MIQHYRQTQEFTLALNYLNFVFTGIFTIEAVIRLIAMELEYFKNGMNVFDFVIVLFSITGKYFWFQNISLVKIYLHIDFGESLLLILSGFIEKCKV